MRLERRFRPPEGSAAGRGFLGYGRGGRQERHEIQAGRGGVRRAASGALAEYVTVSESRNVRGEAGAHHVRAGRRRVPVAARHGAAGLAGQGQAQGGAEGADQRRLGRCGHFRRADREGVRRGGDRRVQHAQCRAGALARRRSRHRLHEAGLHAGTERYDLVVDNVGNHSFAKVRRVLKPDGRYVIVGGNRRWPLDRRAQDAAQGEDGRRRS